VNDDIEEWVRGLLKPDGAIDPADNDRERYVNIVRASVLSEADPDMVEIRTDELRTAVANMLYGGWEPRDVPREVMVHCIQNPPATGYEGFIHVDARKRVRNPNTGIRAKCLECQGNDQVGVRNCPRFNCPLWPFRMGGNPFFGRLVGSTGEEESTETDAEIEALEAEHEALEAQREGKLNGNPS
jgi:hypothetical protein